MSYISSNAEINKVLVKIQAGNPSGDPAADYAWMFVKADGFYLELPGGTVLGPFASVGDPPTAHDHDDRYYTETELQTAGQATVDWGNIANHPDAFIATNLYPHDDASGIGGYFDLLYSPPNGTEAVDTVSANSGSGEVLIEGYISPVLDMSILQGGEWNVELFAAVDNATGVSQIVVKFYTRAAGGTETLLFSITSPELNNTTVNSTAVVFGAIHPDFIIDPTDRLVVKFYAVTTSGASRNISLYHDGTAHYTHIHAPFVPSTAIGTILDHDHSGDAGDGGTFDVANLTSGAAGDGDVLTADGSGGTAWETPSAGISTLDNLTDVNVPSPGDGDVLTWVDGSNEWQAIAPGGTGANHAYYAKLAALLEPDAVEVMQKGTFSYAVASNVTKYLLASWSTRLGSGGRLEQRDPRQALPLRGVTLTGLESDSIAAILDPTLPSYADARDTYFDRLKAIDEMQTQYLGFSGSAANPFLFPGPYGSIILQVTNFDYSWVILCLNSTSGFNVANEVSDSTTQRVSNRLLFPINKNIVSRILTPAQAGGLGGIVYVHLPSTWSGVTDPNTYNIRDDFMGASLDTATKWTRSQSTAGNMEIDTQHQWLKAIGNGTWGQNGIYSQSNITKANGKVFLCDVALNSSWDANGFGMVGFSDGGGQNYSNFVYGVNFGANAGNPQLNIYENGNARGAVGSGFTLGYTYRIRITCTAGNNAAYAIQGGSEYQPLGGASWTDITPGTTSSTTTTLHAGVTMYKNQIWVGDIRIY